MTEAASLGGVAERRGNGLQSRERGFKSRPHLCSARSKCEIVGCRAVGAAGARFLDAEEVTGSIPVPPTSHRFDQRKRGQHIDGGHLIYGQPLETPRKRSDLVGTAHSSAEPRTSHTNG